MFDPSTHKVFLITYVLLHENVNKVPKEDGYDVWNLPKENEESSKEEY
jgi:hypothetical protein